MVREEVSNKKETNQKEIEKLEDRFIKDLNDLKDSGGKPIDMLKRSSVAFESFSSSFILDSIPNINSNPNFAKTFQDRTKDYLGFLRSLLKPTSKTSAIKMSYDWYETDELLSGLIDFKTDLIMNGFDLVAEESEVNKFETLKKLLSNIEDQDLILGLLIDKAEVNQNLNKFERKFDIKEVVKRCLKDYLICDSAILYWRTKEKDNISAEDIFDSDYGELLEVSSISPKNVDWIHTPVMDRMFIDIPQELIYLIEKILEKSELELESIKHELSLFGIPYNAIDAVKEGKTKVELSKEKGDNWVVMTSARKYTGLAWPKMTKIFPDLATRSMFADGDFAGSAMVKNFILHIKSGEGIDSGPRAGDTSNWSTEDDNEALVKTFSGLNKVTVFASNHTVTFGFVFPPPELFSGDKYNKSESKIRDYVGISEVLYSSTGSKYAGGFINLKRVSSEASETRDKISHFLSRLFSYLIENELIKKLNKTKTIRIKFNLNQMKENRQILDETKFMTERSILDKQTIAQILGSESTDITTILLNKLIEQKFSLNFEINLNELKNKNNNNDNNITEDNDEKKPRGRPANDDTVVGEQTRNKSPST